MPTPCPFGASSNEPGTQPALRIDMHSVSPSMEALMVIVPSPRDLRDSVNIGIFNNGLKNHCGHKGIPRLRRDLNAVPYSIAETQLLDRDIELNDLHLLLQGNPLSLPLCQGDTQKTAQPFQHFVGAVRV